MIRFSPIEEAAREDKVMMDKISKLPARLQQIFWLRLVRYRSLYEIGKRFNFTSQRVRRMITMAIHLLQEDL